jgi:hypothetical protein
MPRPVQARAWWADVEDVRERIERKRERERRTQRTALVSDGRAVAGAPAVRRGVRDVRPGRHLMVVPSGRPVPSGLPAQGDAPLFAHRRRRRRALRRVGPRPDRVAAWAVVLGFALVLAAALSAHG